MIKLSKKPKWKKPGAIDLGCEFITREMIQQDYFNRLSELALNTFEWTGLPDTVDPRFLELNLQSKGTMLFYLDDILGDYVCMTTMYGAPLNVYNIPTNRRAYAANGYNYEATAANSVLIYNNYLHTSTWPTIAIYADTMAEIEVSIRVNVNAQRTPVLLRGTEGQQLTLKNLYEKYSGGAPVIFGDKNLDIGGVSVLKTDAPFVADKLELMKQWYWNEILTFLGIENTNTQKGERLITEEVQSSLGHVMAERNVRLNMRQQACEEINRMFDLDIWVEYRKQPWEEVQLNEQVHDSDTMADGGELRPGSTELSNI